MTFYEESTAWCTDYAKNAGLKYRSQLEENVHKYFHSLKEAQKFFDSRYEGKRAIVVPKSGDEFIELEVQYIKA